MPLSVPFGQDYRGPGQADPTKTRDERDAELRQMLQTQNGREVIEWYFAKYTGLLQGKVPPPGLPLVETILKAEYPNG